MKDYIFLLCYYVLVWLVSLVGLLVSVLFMTLWERKILSYIGMRKGPKKVSALGYLQAMGDTLKLFGKEVSQPWVSKSILYLFGPVLAVVMLVGSWLFFHFSYSIMMFYLGMVGFFCVSSLGVYVLLGGGWSSKSKYAVTGCLRGACQKISYEVGLIFLVFVPFCFVGGYKFSWLTLEGWSLYILGMFSIVVVWGFVCICETKRSPFDFAEGESELVSGFNLEYGALQFALLYLGEYGSMVLLSYLTSCCFMSGVWPIKAFFCCFFVYFYIWVRGTLPRFRYDLLMEMAWSILLPFIMLWLFFFFYT